MATFLRYGGHNYFGVCGASPVFGMNLDSSISFAPAGVVNVNRSGETGSFTVTVSNLLVCFMFAGAFVLAMVIFVAESF